MNQMLFSLGSAASLLLTACSDFMPLNTAAPSYIKDVVAYREGSDGLFVYIVLADASGAMTTASGTLTLEISETYGFPPVEVHEPLFSTRVSVQQSSFQRTTVGLGAFQHEVILFSMGRIAYSRFSKPPSERTGKVEVTFVTGDGRSLKGKATIFF